MSYVRIGFSPTFTAGIHFDTGVIMNTYSLDVQLITKSPDHISQNIALERMKYILYEQFSDAIILGNSHKKLAKKYEEVGFRTISLPDEPADQLIGLSIYCKLNAVAEGVVDVLDTSIRSTIGGGVSYLHSDEETIGPYEKEGWWNDAGPTCNLSLSAKKKIVTLNNPTWKTLHLDWDNDDEEETIVKVQLEKTAEKVDNIGENVVEFKPNDKK